MFHTLADKMRNAPLSKKILVILLPGIFLLAIIILTGFLLIVRVDNQMLYETSADLLSYSSPGYLQLPERSLRHVRFSDR